MRSSRAHRLGEPVITALGSSTPEGGFVPETLLVAPGLSTGSYVMMDPDTGEEVGVLELPSELANAHSWKVVEGIEIEPFDDDEEEEGSPYDDEEE